jgi:hypothetical protein
MGDFIATHVIQTGTRRWYVHAEEGERGKLSGVLYTEHEWTNCDNADWTYDPEDGLAFQGSYSHPIVDGASIEKFADCRWTRNDGWRDDGTREVQS